VKVKHGETSCTNSEKQQCAQTRQEVHHKVVLKLRVNVGKVKKIDKHGHPLQKTWHQHGYNTAWVPPNCGMVPTGMEEDCVWNPKRIKIVKTIKPK
ncbi:hypothetical protein JZ751_013498, partial [Albula glossodonta]